MQKESSSTFFFSSFIEHALQEMNDIDALSGYQSFTFCSS